MRRATYQTARRHATDDGADGDPDQHARGALFQLVSPKRLIELIERTGSREAAAEILKSHGSSPARANALASMSREERRRIARRSADDDVSIDDLLLLLSGNEAKETEAAGTAEARPATGKIVEVDCDDIRETPENWKVYRKPSAGESSFVELCQSVRKGITTPLELSADLYILSGHRRYRAAKEVGLLTVPAIIDQGILIGPMGEAERMALLIERNRGARVKSDAEQYLEAAAMVDPEAAIREAEERKAEHFNKTKCSVELVEIKGKSRRTDPSKARSALLNAVVGIIDELRAKDHLPTSTRHIHYQLLQKKVRTSTYRSGFVYGTRKGSAGLLSKLVTDARSKGFIDPDDINDETRPSQKMEHDGSLAKYVMGKLDGLFANYFSNIHADQLNHVELIVEKNTIYPLIFRHVAQRFRIPVSSMKGYGSFPISRDVASRFKASGKDKLVIVYVSDLDPEGVDMPAAVKKYLLADFGVDATTVRAAVTTDQVKRFNLPPDADVKLSSSRAAGFIEQYGEKCWELDSMPTETLIDEVNKAITPFIDIDALNRAFEREKPADVKLARMTAAVGAFVRDKFTEELTGEAEI